MITVDVFIERVRKGSHNSIASFIHNLNVIDVDSTIDHPEVQKLINETFGKKLIVQVHPNNEPAFYPFEIEKSKAVL